MLTKKFIKKVLDVFMLDISSLGGSIFYLFVVIFVFLMDEIVFSLYLVLVYIFVMLFTILIRTFYFKHRPKKQKHDALFLDKIDASSFPSAHAGRISALLFSTILFFPLNLKLLIFFPILTIIILYSRFYLKKHYSIDIFVGIFVGFLISFCLSFLF